MFETFPAQSFDEATDPSFGALHLPKLRAELRKMQLDGFLVPHEDEHQNEYLPAANDRLAWLTGFTGSAGAAVVLQDRAAIFVDGRYTEQLRAQADPVLFEFLDLTGGGVAQYLETVKAGSKIGYDPRLHSPEALELFKAAVAKAGAELVPTPENPLDLAWGAVRPAQPLSQTFVHPLKFAGESSEAKRQRLGQGLAKQGADAAILSAPFSVAWLFNLRGADVARTPVTLGQAILHADGSAELFIDPAKVSDEARQTLSNQVTLHAPDQAPERLRALAGKAVLIDPAQSSAWWFEQTLAAGARVVRGQDPCALPRACKNPAEIEGSRQAHLRDGAALTRFLYWLATEAQQTLPDEIEAIERLEALRREDPTLRELSFDTIAGAGPNAALPHYRCNRASNRRVEKGSVLLVDSGGQYLDGTTDVTRTVAIGAPGAELKRRNTLVLKGHIALARIRFPAGTTGSALDALARMALWADGLDYDHGTGHGVGAFLGVHEGPQRIAKAPNTTPLQTGMILSNEPGYYKPGAYGIRIENLQVVTPAEMIPGGERPMHGFETLTFAPIDKSLIAAELLTPEERAWLNSYHGDVLHKIAPLVPAEVAAWLEQACAPV